MTKGTCKTVKEFCKLMKVHSHKTLVEVSNQKRFRVLASEFEVIHGIVHTIDAIDDNHILILTLVISEEDYYYWKCFHTTSL